MKSLVHYATVLSLLWSACQGFAPSCPQQSQTTTTRITSTNLHARADSSSAIDDAMRISKFYGNASPEARVAWDIVEEIDASDNL